MIQTQILPRMSNQIILNILWHPLEKYLHIISRNNQYFFPDQIATSRSTAACHFPISCCPDRTCFSPIHIKSIFHLIQVKSCLLRVSPRQLQLLEVFPAILFSKVLIANYSPQWYTDYLTFNWKSDPLMSATESRSASATLSQVEEIEVCGEMPSNHFGHSVGRDDYV